MRVERLVSKAISVIAEPKFRFPLNEPINVHVNSFAGRVIASPLALCSWGSYLIPDLGKKHTTIRMNERVVEIPKIYSLLEPRPGLKVLDFGCNESKFALELASLGCDVTGVDLEQYRLTHPNLTFINKDFLEVDLERETFDVVTAISALEHTGLTYYSGQEGERADKRIVQKFREILKPGGQLCVSVPVGIEEEFPPYYRSYGKSFYELFDGFELKEKSFFRGHGRGESRENASYWMPCAEDEAFEQKNQLYGLSAVGIFHFIKS